MVYALIALIESNYYYVLHKIENTNFLMMSYLIFLFLWVFWIVIIFGISGGSPGWPYHRFLTAIMTVESLTLAT